MSNLLVYRVQTVDGHGPYGWTEKGSNGPRVYPAEKDVGPGPWSDGLLDDPAALRSFHAGEARFGFPSFEAAARWFDIDRLYALGFEVTAAPARRVWVGKTGRQVMYLPKFERMPKEDR